MSKSTIYHVQTFFCTHQLHLCPKNTRMSFFPTDASCSMCVHHFSSTSFRCSMALPSNQRTGVSPQQWDHDIFTYKTFDIQSYITSSFNIIIIIIIYYILNFHYAPCGSHPLLICLLSTVSHTISSNYIFLG